ncbi:MAG: hypothetical protein QG565_1090 [Campylobacterota bacterium]|nr:hypothetical protein [Campylobacterota bacterium]MDQ1267446.1 hypothetical protein [Campylobacterota bacterium]MDQ1338186.1 hypothetical protein [Campylobacterota bacterium]
MSRKRNRLLALDVENINQPEAEIVDKVTLWMLRLILKEGGHRELIDQDGDFDYSGKDIALFLGLGKYVYMEKGTCSRNEVLAILAKKLQILEKQKSFTSLPILEKNISRISKLMELNAYESQVLEFSVLVKQFEILQKCTNLLGRELNTMHIKRILSSVLCIERKEIDAMFATDAKFMRSSLLSIDRFGTRSLESKLEFLNDSFCENLLSQDENVEILVRDIIKPCAKSELKVQDYKHIELDVELLLSHLQKSLTSKQKGVNILLYGVAGTGKTELCKVVAHKLGAKLYEVSYTNQNEEAIDGKERLKAYKSAQCLLSKQKTVLMYDEAEDIFESSMSLFAPPQRQRDKAWINRMLESNEIPTIWVTNNIDSVDNAIIRRFDMSIAIPIPPKKTRKEIIKKYSNGLLDASTLEKLADNEHISPAVIATATKVIQGLEKHKTQEAFTHLLNNTLKAQGHHEIATSTTLMLPSNYNPSYVNASADLEQLAQGIQETKNARICLYGPAGTGKSAFGKYIAQSIKRPCIIKKGSDLLSKWVGEAEKNIANAFQEAKEEKAVLIFDEVDSFLSDREGASNSWEITQVNEMLVQMESFEGVFIATTNLMQNLDKASLRRFDLKLEFGYLQPKQAWEMFCSYAKTLGLSKPLAMLEKEVEQLRYLTPGDFAAIVRQNRFRPLKNAHDLIERLKEEIAVKRVDGAKMGFL